jgi:hypothetical protein
MSMDEFYPWARTRARRTPTLFLRRLERRIIARSRIIPLDDRNLARLGATRRELRRREQSRPSRWRLWRFAP